MDPAVWGPLAWSLIMDICWQVQTNELANTAKTAKAVNIFFSSMQYLLPCVYCRASYRCYLKEMGMTPTNKCDSSLRWAYVLKNKVNDKLGRGDRVAYEKLEKRMSTCICMSSMKTMLDFLFIIGANFDADLDNLEERHRKKAWFMALLLTLPDVLVLMEYFGPLERALRTKPITYADCESRDSVVEYLCKISKQIFQAKQYETAQAMCKQYSFAKSEKR